jgi:hypothetical protein
VANEEVGIVSSLLAQIVNMRIDMMRSAPGAIATGSVRGADASIKPGIKAINNNWAREAGDTVTEPHQAIARGCFHST